ncbi:hypothetical protein L1987_36350 [Smallanthus sonchifolius]|uniref:Uncharacterized protein n=1 Tax=Smallanthus sonchifolius TaxID=185202 RepID=A0ACB9HEJ6_9ASTR|nr:hypothetical protein L1987_36350 [Smallanthus sonchifolius]
MGVLKGYVRNRNRPGGSIVQGYTSEEVTEFCTGYLEEVEKLGNGPDFRVTSYQGKDNDELKTFRRMDLQMSEKRKRGASTCKKKRSSSDQSGIKFNANGIAIGGLYSWVGAEFKNRVPINKVAKDVDSKLCDRIWEYAKETWKISDDHAKHTTLRKGKVIRRNFQSYLAKSQKTRMSAAKNIDPTRIGRWGYSGLETIFESRWNQLVKSYPELDVVQDDGSKMYFVSRAHLNSVTNLYELGPNPQSKGFKTKKKQSRARESTAVTSPGKGLVHFTTKRTLQGRSMKDEFVKVQVDRVEEGCTQMPFLPESCIPGEFGATSDKQMMPNEIDVYRRYSYALRDDEGFYELLADNHFSHNRTERVQFYQHTELVNVYDQHTESIHVSQHTETVHASESEKENEKIAKEKKR